MIKNIEFGETVTTVLHSPLYYLSLSEDVQERMVFQYVSTCFM